MRKKPVLLLLFLSAFQWLTAQYLPAVFQDQVVSLQAVSSGLFVDANFGGGTNAIVNNMQPLYKDQQFLLVSTAQANWYRIRDQRTLKFITLHSPASNQSVYLEATGYGGDSRLQEFQFVAQTEPGRFKIHTRFQESGVDLLVEVNPAAAGITGLRLGKNITVGNSEHQKFDAARLYPDVNPSSAVPTLADRFENRSCGFTMKHNGFQLRKSSNTDMVYQSAAYNGFDNQFVIQYTDEVGWFKIKHKVSGKYLTVQMAAANVNLTLSFDIGVDDNLQKFKFIEQGNDSTYKIHTKYSYGIGVNLVGLVLEVPSSGADTLRCAANNTSLAAGADWNQQFIIRKYLPPAAEFDGGAATIGAGKITGKQYYISIRESLAMMAPVVQGVDTFVRWQTTPVYGEAAEWIFEDGRTRNGTTYFKVRFGKTGQYLYLPAATEDTTPPAGLRLKLKKPTDTAADKRYEFAFLPDGSLNHWSQLLNGTGPVTYYRRNIIANEDGYLCTDYSPSNFGYMATGQFCINLSLPLDSTKLYAFATKNNGHFLSDSGSSGSGQKILHIKFADLSCMWNFVPATNGRYYIKNSLSGSYLTNNGSSNTGANIYTTDNRNAAGTLWEVLRAGNYYNIRNAQGGRYLGLLNHPLANEPVYQGLSSDAGTDWIVTRADYYPDPLVTGPVTLGLLTNYNPLPQNAFNDNLYRDRFIRNIGLPYEPVLQRSLYGIQADTLGVSLTHISSTADFMSVVRSALAYRYNFSPLQVDSAIKNYKLDSSGMRTEVVHALKDYILENLAFRNRNTWTYHEKEMVGYLERHIKDMRVDYANRIETGWNQFRYLTGTGTDLSYSTLWFPSVATDYEFPEYYPVSAAEAVSMSEYAIANTQRHFLNPGTLALAYTLPAATTGGAYAVLITTLFKLAKNGLKQSASAGVEALDAVEVAEAPAESAAPELTARLVGAAIGSNVVAAVSVIITATQMLVSRATDVAKFVDFDQSVKDKVDGLRNASIYIEIMGGDNQLSKLCMAQDFDIILGTGERFDGLKSGSYVFNGDGFWSDSKNWQSGRLPLLPLSASEITIAPKSGGKCNIDVPLQVPQGTRLIIKPGASVRVNNYLTVPALFIKQP